MNIIIEIPAAIVDFVADNAVGVVMVLGLFGLAVVLYVAGAKP